MRKISINDLDTSTTDYYIVAETAFSHEGDIEYIKKQIFKAQEGNCNAIKFQMLIDVESSYIQNIQLIKKWTFTKQIWKDIIKFTKEKTDLEVVILPIDYKAAKFCLDNIDYIDAIEIHSINLNDIILLEILKDLGKPIILGAGGRYCNEIEFAIEKLRNEKIILMHGFQSFPTKYENINLSKISMYKTKFNSIVGYADHTSYDDNFRYSLIDYAYLNGARIFECHLVLEKGKERIDYEAGIESKDFIEIRTNLNKLLKIQGKDNINYMTEDEIRYRDRQKKIIALTDISEGELFNRHNIGYKVINHSNYLQQMEYESLIGKKAKRFFERESVIKIDF